MFSIGYLCVIFVVVDHTGGSKLMWVLKVWLRVSLLPIDWISKCKVVAYWLHFWHRLIGYGSTKYD